MKIHSVTPVVSQMVLVKLGMYCSERLNVDIYYLKEAIDLLISDFGEEKLEKMYNSKFGQGTYKPMMKRYNRFGQLISKLKTFYDAITDKAFNKKEVDFVEKYFRKQFSRIGSKVALIQVELYKLFLFLISNSTMQNQVIKSEYFNVLEHKNFRKIEAKTKDSKQKT